MRHRPGLLVRHCRDTPARSRPIRPLARGAGADQAEAAEPGEAPVRPEDGRASEVDRDLPIRTRDPPEQGATAEGLAAGETAGDVVRVPELGRGKFRESTAQ